MADILKKYPKVTCRPGPVVDRALGRYCKDNDRSRSEVQKQALQEFLPRKYLIEARRKLNGKRKALVK